MTVSRSTVGAVCAVVLFLSISLTLALTPAETIVETVGSNNAYLLMFVLGAIGGLTTFSGIPYHVILMSLAAGGINPIILGCSTALGVMVGDSTTYVISKQVRHAVPVALQHFLEKVSRFLNRQPQLLVPILFLYGALSPFSNDFIVASLTLTGYTYRQIIVPLAAGNVVFNIGLAYLGFFAYDAIMAWW